MRLTRQSLLLFLFLAVPAFAAEKPNPFLVQAKVHYQGLDFEKCMIRLEQASRWKNSTHAELVEIELYSGLCAFNLGDEEEARRSFHLALELDPNVKLPPYSSPRLVAFLDSIARSMPREAAEEAEAEKEAAQPETPTPSSTPPAVPDSPRKVELQPLAPPEQALLTQTTLVASPQPKKLFLPVLLSSTSVAAAGGAVYFGLKARAEEARANDPDTFYDEALASREAAMRNARLTNMAIGVATTAAIGALLSYVLQ